MGSRSQVAVGPVVARGVQLGLAAKFYADSISRSAS